MVYAFQLEIQSPTLSSVTQVEFGVSCVYTQIFGNTPILFYVYTNMRQKVYLETGIYNITGCITSHDGERYLSYDYKMIDFTLKCAHTQARAAYRSL